MATPYTDLSGIFYLQEKYLAELNALYAKDPTTTAAVADAELLRKKLANVYSAYQAVSPSADSVLTEQSKMYNILSREQRRLDEKKTSVDTALAGRKRMAHFSDSYSKKYLAQMKILVFIIIVVLLYLGLNFLNTIIPIPDSVYLTIWIIVGIYAYVVIVMSLFGIYSRYNMDFDKINFTAPTKGSLLTGNIDGNVTLVAGNIGCYGKACCPDGNENGTIWNPSTLQCVQKLDASPSAAAAAFTLLSQVYPMQTLQINGTVIPYEPSEINSYTKL